MKNIALASPERMSPGARAGEIAAILATATATAIARDSVAPQPKTACLVAGQPKQRAVGLGCLVEQRVHTALAQQKGIS